MERNDSADSNPWGAEPSYAQRISSYHAQQDTEYDQQMNDVLVSPHASAKDLHDDPQPSSGENGRDGSVEDDDEDDFVYDGIDNAGGPSASTADDSIVSGDMSSDTYSVKLKDILGSDDGEEEEDQHEEALASIDTQMPARSSITSPSSPTTQKGPLPGADIDTASNTTPRHAEAAPSDDGSSFRYPHPLPNDVSFDTRSASSLQHHQHSRQRLASQPSSSRIFTPRSTSGTSLSLLRQSASAISASTPQRPVAYPSLSRLRASVGRAASASLTLPKHIYAESGTSSGDIPATPSSSSSPKKARLPLPFEFTANGLAAADDDASRSALGESSVTHRSRQSSFSTSVSGSIAGRNKRRRPRVSFPYGGTIDGSTPLPTAQSASSLLSDPASSFSARRQSIQQHVVLGGGNEENSDHIASEPTLKETTINERDELSRDFVKWSALRRLIANAKAGPDAPEPEATVLAVAGGLIAVGFRGGKTVVCDFAQEPIASCGHDGRGHGDAVTALAFSSDHSFLGVGHASGNIFLYDLSNPGRAARHVPPVPLSSVKLGKKEGHLSGSAIVHIGFIGLRHTAIVTADNKGLAFYHALGRILGVSSNDTLRLLGKYPQYEHEDELGLGDGKKRNTIFQLCPLPLGSRPHAADDTTFVAMITPTKMVLVGLKPSPRTWYRKLNHAQAEEKPTVVALTEEQKEPEPGCLAWYPASTETDGKRRRQTNPILAFSFGNTLHLVRLVVRRVEQRHDPRAARPANGPGARTVVEEVEPIELTGEDGIEEPDGIVALQWFSPDLLMLTTRSGLALFDCRAGRVTERMRGGSASAIIAKTVEQRYYDAVLLGKPFDPHAELPDDAAGSNEAQTIRSWALNHSVRISKGRSFFLTKSDLVVGTLLSWADRLLLYVTQGDFLSAIELTTLFHQGKFLGSAVGLPSDPDERTRIVADKLRELMAASAEYAFSPDRLTDSTHVTADGRGVDRTSLFQGLARVCARACLSLGDLDLLFDMLYDKYEGNGIEAIFVGQMEDFIVSGELRSLPIPVVQRLVAFRKDRQEYAQAERIIWHVNPKCLDLDQALSLCLDRKLYDALTYVFNAALDDYVSPIIEMLHPLRRAILHRRKIQQQQEGVFASDEASDDPYAHIRVSEAADQVEAVEAEVESEERDVEDGYRVFSYLSVILTGNKYPSQEPFEHDEQACKAKSSIYSFVFSGGSALWPPGPGGKLVLYGLNDGPGEEGDQDNSDQDHEPIYPYLRLLLEFDAEAFLDALDLAFEDSFLDDEDVVGKRLSRQLVVDVLLELASSQSAPARSLASDLSVLTNQSMRRSKAPELPLMARIFAHIFVARNAPKYPQFLQLSPQIVDTLLRSLALPASGDVDAVEMELIETTHEDRELAAECLLSHYKPRFDDNWLDTFERAGFHRILRSAFRQEKKWDRLLGMYLRDHLQAAPLHDADEDVADEATSPGGDAFAHFEETLFNAARKDTPGRDQLQTRLHEQLSDHIIDLLDLDPLKTASLMDRFFPHRHEEVLQRLAQLDEKRLLLYLQCFFEPVQVSKAAAAQTMSQHQPQNGDVSATDLEWTNDVADKAASAVVYNVDVGRADPEHLPRKDREAYIDLLCRYEPEAVVRNLDAKGGSYFDLERLVQACRSSETAIDGSRVAKNSEAVLWALDRLGRSKEAFEELDSACARTADSLVFVASEWNGSEGASSVAEELLSDVRRCVNVAVRLCIERANAFGGVNDSDDEDDRKTSPADSRLDTDEVWYRLLRSLVRLVHDVAHLGSSSPSADVDTNASRSGRLLNGVRNIVKETLSDLISSTAAEAVSFPALFRRLTGSDTDAKARSGNPKASNIDEQAGVAEYYAEIRSVLDGMLSAYHLRSELLAITNKLFDRYTFHQFRRLHAQRRHGWRPAGGASARCAGCDVLLVGPRRGTSATRATDGGGAQVLAGSSEADKEAAVEDLRRKAFQQSRSASTSTFGGRNAQPASLLMPSTPLLQTHHRRAKSPYDEKAAPLASPRIDKGKGVVRSASTELPRLNGNGTASNSSKFTDQQAEEGREELHEVDGYFASEFGAGRPTWPAHTNGGGGAALTRSNSTASSVGFSLRINDEPEQKIVLSPTEEGGEVANDEESADGDGTLTPSRFGRAGESGIAVNGDDSIDRGQSEADEAESMEGERIVVQKTGLMYHERCWLRVHAEQSE